MQPPRLDPRNDVVFKLLFARNEDLLKALLDAVLQPFVPIEQAEVQNPELPKSFSDDKGSFLDIRVRLADGSLLDVEMQSVKRPELRSRALYYWSKLFGTQLVAGQDYAALAPVVSVLFLDYREFLFQRFHEIFRLRADHSSALFSPLLEIHTIELPNLRQEIGEHALVRWCKFLSLQGSEELRLVAAEDAMIAKAEEVLSEISSDPRARELALDRELAAASVKIMRGEERREGRREGRQEGRREVRLEILTQLLTQRFGELPEAARDRLGAATTLDLELWTDRLLDATSLDDLLESREP